MNSNPSASASSDDNAVSKAKSIDDQQNANVQNMAKKMNEIDMAFRDSVITKDSSSDFMANAEAQPPSSMDKAPLDVEISEAKADLMENDGAISSDLDEINNGQDENGAAAALVNIKPEDDKDWKPDVGSVYNRVLNIQNTEPKKYIPKEFVRKEKHEVENIQVLPEILNCPKCNRKVAAGAINHHVKFCNPDDADAEPTQ